MAGIKEAIEVHKKTPDEVKINTMQFGNDDMVSGETITAISAVTVTRKDGVSMGGNDLTKDAQSFSGTVTQFTWSKGLDLVDYHVKVKVTTTAGQTLEGCGLMHVEQC